MSVDGRETDSVTTPPRSLISSVDELLAGATHRQSFAPAESRSTSGFQRVVIDGQRCVVKYVHPDGDFLMRAGGDIGCIPLRAWTTGVMDSAPDVIDHATVGVAPWGRNGWGAAILMRDVSAELIPADNMPVTEHVHETLLDHLAVWSARTWGWVDPFGLLRNGQRWEYFSPASVAGDEALGFPEVVPRLALEGWAKFAQRAPRNVVELVAAARDDASGLVEALACTPPTLLHGDWKFANLGHAADGRTVLIDWTYVGAGPICHELAWYLALNGSRLPHGHTKETTIENLRRALRRHGVNTEAWWDRQLGLCLLGALAQFGWEKALGDDVELRWWCARASDAQQWL